MTRRGADRGLSPVVGTVLMIGIVLVFSAVAGYVFLGMSDTSDPAPQVAWEAEPSEELSDWRLVHGGGDRVDGGHLELHGTADPDAAAGTNLSAEGEVSFYPTSSEVDVVWYGDDGESYRLTTIEVEQPLPEPDLGCEEIDEILDGSGNAKIQSEVLHCDIDSKNVVEVWDAGAVVGDVSESNELDVESATVYGSVDVEDVANVQDGAVTGSITSRTADVKVENTTVDRPIEAQKVAEVLDDSVVGGAVVSDTKATKIDGSVVEGDVTAGDGQSVDIDDATIEGHVYADPSDFDCTDSTIDGQDCSSYEPRDPDDW